MSDLHHAAPTFIQTARSAQPAVSAPSPRLVSAAHEFEAELMKELLAPLSPGHDLLDGSEDGEDSSSALSSFGGEALGKAISQHGGLGIAATVLKKLESASNHSGKSSVPGASQGNLPGPPVK